MTVVPVMIRIQTTIETTEMIGTPAGQVAAGTAVARVTTVPMDPPDVADQEDLAGQEDQGDRVDQEDQADQVAPVDPEDLAAEDQTFQSFQARWMTELSSDPRTCPKSVPSQICQS